MRAGLLSDPAVIATINEKFVSTWINIDDIMPRLGASERALAVTLVKQHEYPLDFVFLSPEGKMITRLTSFKDFRDANPAVGHPRREEQMPHAQVFLSTVAQYFGED